MDQLKLYRITEEDYHEDVYILASNEGGALRKASFCLWNQDSLPAYRKLLAEEVLFEITYPHVHANDTDAQHCRLLPCLTLDNDGLTLEFKVVSRE